jgi:hypothetical protein
MVISVQRLHMNFECIPASSGAGRAGGLVQHPISVAGSAFDRNCLCVALRPIECDEYREMPASNRQGAVTNAVCSSDGDDMVFDGAWLTGPQPYTGEKTRVSPECLWFPLECGLEPRTPHSAEIRWSDSTSFRAWRRSILLPSIGLLR